MCRTHIETERSNVFALEAVLKSHPSAGELRLSLWSETKTDIDYAVKGIFLTFIQFLYVACQTVSTQLTWNRSDAGSITRWVPRIKKTVVPIKRWMIQVVLFLAVSVLNNYAFGLKVSTTPRVTLGQFELKKCSYTGASTSPYHLSLWRLVRVHDNWMAVWQKAVHRRPSGKH